MSDTKTRRVLFWGLLVSYFHSSVEREQDSTYKIKRVNRLCKERGQAANRERAEMGKNTEKRLLKKRPPALTNIQSVCIPLLSLLTKTIIVLVQ